MDSSLFLQVIVWAERERVRWQQVHLSVPGLPEFAPGLGRLQAAGTRVHFVSFIVTHSASAAQILQRHHSIILGLFFSSIFFFSENE